MIEPPTPRPARSQPVELAEAELLVGRAQAIAKGWLLTLLERAPLEAVAAIPAGAVAAEGPALCAAFARALASDAELERLRPTGDLAPAVARIGALVGARDAAGVLAAVDALRACVWAAALEARGQRTDGIATLAERLAAVALVVGGTALAGVTGTPAADPVDGAADAAADAEQPASGADGSPASSPVAEAPATGATIGASATVEPPGVTRLPARSARPGVVDDMVDGDLWIETLERHVDRAQREGGGLALLRVELVDGERVAAAAGPDDREVPYSRLAQAIRRAIRRQDLVAADKQGRAWVIAPAVGRAGAIALAERVCAGIEHGEQLHGAPLQATIGYAVYGEDGDDAHALIERAEEAMLAASASGVRIGEALPPDRSGDDGGRPGPRLVR